MDIGCPRAGSRRAARTAGLLVLAAASGAVFTELSIAGSQTRDVSWAALAVCAALIAFGVVLWFAGHKVSERLLVVSSMCSVLIVLGMNLLTQDASGGAQMAFVFPVVYAGAFLPARAAWSTAVLAVVGHGIVVFSLLPVDRAMSDSIFGSLVICALTWGLVLGRRDQEKLVERLDELASADPLTGLVNRRAFADRGSRHARSAAQASGPREDSGDGSPLGPVGMLVLDVDRFKQLNDGHGHPAGDAALVQLAAVLRSVAGPGDVVARLGGDEFALLCPGISRADLAARADEVRSAVRASPVRRDDHVVPLTVSIGAAHDPLGVLDHESLYSAADAAMYDAKVAGRDRWVMSPG